MWAACWPSGETGSEKSDEDRRNNAWKCVRRGCIPALGTLQRAQGKAGRSGGLPGGGGSVALAQASALCPWHHSVPTSFISLPLISSSPDFVSFNLFWKKPEIQIVFNSEQDVSPAILAQLPSSLGRPSAGGWGWQGGSGGGEGAVSVEAPEQRREVEKVKLPRAERGGGQPCLRGGKRFTGETQPWLDRKPRPAAGSSWPLPLG